MTHRPDHVAIQLADELAMIANRVGPILGLVLHDTIQARIRDRVDTIAAQLRDEDDDNLLAEIVQDLLHLLHGDCDPDPAWWRTPVGQLCARSLGRTDSDSVSHSVAAAMLGVHRGTVAQMVSRGTLDRHPDGGVLRASVMQRLARG